MRKVGAILLIVAFVLAVTNHIWPAWIVLIIVGLIDLYLIYVKKEITITKWIRSLTPHRIDNIIMLGLVGLCWWLKGPQIALWFLFGLLNNHLFERND